MADTQWSLTGEYFESCNCEILCPCIVQGTGVRPTEGHCDVALAFHIHEGEFNGIDLGGLTFVAANYTPGPMADGDWTSVLYIDERATLQQREALEHILSGNMGGPAERWRSLTTHFMGIAYVPIDFRVDGKVHTVTIPHVMDFRVEPVIARGQREAMLLSHTGHGVNRDLYLARGTRGSYTDHGMRWDNTGKNGHYAPFSWQWSNT